MECEGEDGDFGGDFGDDGDFGVDYGDADDLASPLPDRVLLARAAAAVYDAHAAVVGPFAGAAHVAVERELVAVPIEVENARIAITVNNLFHGNQHPLFSWILQSQMETDFSRTKFQS